MVFHTTVYEDVEDYKKSYELDDAGMVSWAKEAAEIMGMPMHTNYSFAHMPKSMLPATLAVFAGQRQGSDKGHRLYRALLCRSIVEEQDVTQEATILEAVRESGLDRDTFKRDWADQSGLKAALEGQGEGAPPVHVGFYNIAVTDGRGRTVYLDQQFDPLIVEGAIDYLTNASLKKSKPTDIAGYLKQQGPTPAIEIERVFGLPSKDAQTQLEGLEQLGQAKSSRLAGAPFWSV